MTRSKKGGNLFSYFTSLKYPDKCYKLTDKEKKILASKVGFQVKPEYKNKGIIEVNIKGKATSSGQTIRNENLKKKIIKAYNNCVKTIRVNYEVDGGFFTDDYDVLTSMKQIKANTFVPKHLP